MELSHLINLISQLPENAQMKYVRGTEFFTFLNIDKNEIRVNALNSKGEEQSWGESFLQKLASLITENVPYALNSIMNNQGTFRPIIDSIIAHTKEFYWTKNGKAKEVVWIPSHPHSSGILCEYEYDQIPTPKVKGQEITVNINPDIKESQLVEILKNMDAYNTDAVVLFGLKYAPILKNFDIEKIVYDAQLSNSVTDKINTGIQLHTLIHENKFNVGFYNQVKKDNTIEVEFKQYIEKLPTEEYLKDSYLEAYKNENLIEYAKKYCDSGVLYDIISEENLEELYSEILNSDFNREAHHIYSSAIRHFKRFIKKRKNITPEDSITIPYSKYIIAIQTKPFVLLAGISGTGKSRIVRELARSCYKPGTPEHDVQKPANFEMIQVRPNWHDSTELLGYVSRINGEQFIAGDFIKFIVKAWENPDMPHFLCLDEMNLAPVEQYFAEYLSVFESRRVNNDGTITTDPIINVSAEQWYYDFCNSITSKEYLRTQFIEFGISIPSNLIVMGTVNMDETTYSFSRKVLDRAMTIEMNEVNLNLGLFDFSGDLGYLGPDTFLPEPQKIEDLYADNPDICDSVLGYLENINIKLENTPFKVAYRTRNEFLQYVINAIKQTQDEDMVDKALDDVTSMKILSRIEGDTAKVDCLNGLEKYLKEYFGEDFAEESVSLKKIANMQKRLNASGYTSFWD